jgi:hypothetical protein
MVTTTLGNYDGQNSHALASTALLTITFLIYGPQKQLITIETRLLLLFAEINGYHPVPGIYDGQTTTLVSITF